MHTPNPDLITKLAKEYGTPFYIFDEAIIRRQCSLLKTAVPYPKTVFRYAIKALSCTAILRIIKDQGYWADASSYNEVKRALHAGFLASQILYTGEGADPTEFKEMLSLGVSINCSSLDQVRLVGSLKPNAEISIRFNPGEGHGHHHKVNTGGPHSKHGIYITDVEKLKTLCSDLGLVVRGVHTHIGSGTDLAHWLKIKEITLEIARGFDQISFIDLGGGLPVVYNKEAESSMPINEWGAELTKSLNAFSREKGKEIELQLEPGRFLVAESGFLVAEVQSFKTTPENNFVIVNTGFNHNIRPAMYGAFHPIEFISKSKGPVMSYAVAGNLCESGDVFTINEEGEIQTRMFSELAIGDLMIMGLVGAYSYSMMSEYNSMNLPAAILINNNGTPKLIERRGNFEDLLRREVP